MCQQLVMLWCFMHTAEIFIEYLTLVDNAASSTSEAPLPAGADVDKL